MGAPYVIVDRFYTPVVRLHPNTSLVGAMAALKAYREIVHPDVRLHGDDMDEDCIDGLSPVERQMVDEAGL